MKHYEGQLDAGTKIDLSLEYPPEANASLNPRPVPRLPYIKKIPYIITTLLSITGTGETQLWLARPEDSNAEGDTFILKFVRPGPSLHSSYSRARARESVTQAAAAYKVMGDCQGSTLPYFFGLHEVPLPWGAQALVIALEYIESPYRSLDELMEVIDSTDETKTLYKDYGVYRALAQSGITTVRLAHERQLLHGDVHRANVLVDSTYSGRAVLIDWTGTHMSDPEDLPYSMNLEYENISYVFLGNKRHYKALIQEPFRIHPHCMVSFQIRQAELAEEARQAAQAEQAE